MAACDWRPWDTANHLRQAREAATPTASLAFIEEAIHAGLAEIKIIQSLAEGDPSRCEHYQRAIERIAWAGEHLARHATSEGLDDEIPF